MIIRMFDTAIDPNDEELAKDLFRRQVQPAFARFDGCQGVDMYIGLEGRGHLIEVAAISRWDSKESIDAALGTEEYTEAMLELKKLFQHAPLVRHFETID
ncbi:MAG: antibiotic biosynthesis monooxygenase [Actinobacteria bacterium]|nr:antibiotic biosynthesis monooxygenase [Actinomycetota bacterium]